MLHRVAVRLQRHFGAEQPRTLDRDPSFLRTALIDATVASYVEWREEAAAVRAAYRRWRRARPGDRRLAAAAYVAALDREERAADAHAHLLSHVGDVLRRGHGVRV
jgi:hypothetical protein